jgi:hypothetical protein
MLRTSGCNAKIITRSDGDRDNDCFWPLSATVGMCTWQSVNLSHCVTARTAPPAAVADIYSSSLGQTSYALHQDRYDCYAIALSGHEQQSCSCLPSHSRVVYRSLLRSTRPQVSQFAAFVLMLELVVTVVRGSPCCVCTCCYAAPVAPICAAVLLPKHRMTYKNVL